MCLRRNASMTLLSKSEASSSLAVTWIETWNMSWDWNDGVKPKIGHLIRTEKRQKLKIVPKTTGHRQEKTSQLPFQAAGLSGTGRNSNIWNFSFTWLSLQALTRSYWKAVSSGANLKLAQSGNIWEACRRSIRPRALQTRKESVNLQIHQMIKTAFPTHNRQQVALKAAKKTGQAW